MGVRLGVKLLPSNSVPKPILYTVGEKDPTFTPAVARAVVDATAGPVDFHIEPDGVHQLMSFHTAAYSDVVLDWCRKQI